MLLKKDTGLVKALFTKRGKHTKPKNPLPLLPIPQEELLNASHDVIYRLGHSTVLMRLDSKYFLTDPVFSETASPLRWPSLGLKRFQSTPISIGELPAIAAVLISHDHYDHLDRRAIRQLIGRTGKFIVPVGVGNRLRRWGVPSEKIIERDWWQSVSLSSVNFTATPTRHFTGRGLFDRNKSKASGWAIESSSAKIFYGGDSGYFPGFHEIGERFGGFDLTMLENGAYSPFWPDIHMSPEETLQAHLDLKGESMLPIHNGTFDLSFHAWFEPMERLHQLAEQTGTNILTPVFGEPVSPVDPVSTTLWWREQVSRELGQTDSITNIINQTNHQPA